MARAPRRVLKTIESGEEVAPPVAVIGRARDTEALADRRDRLAGPLRLEQDFPSKFSHPHYLQSHRRLPSCREGSVGLGSGGVVDLERPET